MQIDNVRRIVIEDYPKESRETVAKLAEILNSFMDQIVDLSQGKIDFDNLNRTLIFADLSVNADFVPVGVAQINTKLNTYSGVNIVNVQSLSGGPNTVSAPYLDCTYQGNGIVKINKIYGLPVGKKCRVTFEFIG